MKMTKADQGKIRKAQMAVKSMRSKFDVAEKKAMVHVRKNPEMALLMATGVGAAIGAAVVYALNDQKR